MRIQDVFDDMPHPDQVETVVGKTAINDIAGLHIIQPPLAGFFHCRFVQFQAMQLPPSEFLHLQQRRAVAASDVENPSVATNQPCDTAGVEPVDETEHKAEWIIARTLG